MEPLQMTSNRPSILKNLSAVAMSGNSCSSSKKIRVSPSINRLDGSIREIFFDDIRRFVAVRGDHFVLWLLHEIDRDNARVVLCGKALNGFGLADLPRPFDDKRLFIRICFPFRQKSVDFAFLDRAFGFTSYEGIIPRQRKKCNHLHKIKGRIFD